MTAAGVILASTFAAVAFVPLTAFQRIAFTTAAGLLIDTLIVRPIITPAVLSLLGRSAQWPAHVVVIVADDRRSTVRGSPPTEPREDHRMRTWILSARESFWFLPAVFGVVAILLAQGLVTIDRVSAQQISDLAFFSELSADGGRSILTTIGTSMLTVAGTSFSITISVLATTSSTYGPRLVRNFMADRSNQFVLAMFTSTFLYCLIVLRSVRTSLDDRSAFVPTLGVHLAVVIAVVDAAVLVYFIHHIATSVQITTLQKRVQVDLVRAVDRTHPAELDPGWTRDGVVSASDPTPIGSVKDGYIQQADLDELLATAVKHDLVLEIVAMPGVHVIEGDPLVVVQNQEQPDPAAIRGIRSAFAIGVERTPEQDVRFALQQLIEVAVRGLASGTNDPYTTVSALDLSRVALVPLVAREEGPRGRLDDEGRRRLSFEWPTAEFLVGDVLDSVRQYGTEHPAVVRAGLDLAERLGAAARSEELRNVIAAEVEDLMEAYADTGPDAPDVAALRRRFEQVIRGLR